MVCHIVTTDSIRKTRHQLRINNLTNGNKQVENYKSKFSYFWLLPGGYFLVKGYRGCAAGWGRISTTGLTIMGLHF